jgi:hypothetical protein
MHVVGLIPSSYVRDLEARVKAYEGKSGAAPFV